MLFCCALVNVTLRGVADDSCCAGLPEQPAATAVDMTTNASTIMRDVRSADFSLSFREREKKRSGFAHAAVALIKVSIFIACPIPGDATSRRPAPGTARRCRRNDWLRPAPA